MATPFIRQVQPFCRLPVAFEEPDGISALDRFRQIVQNRFLDMGQCMFYTPGKAMSRNRNGIRILCACQCFLNRLGHSRFFQRRDACHLATEFFLQPVGVDEITAFCEHVHHVDGDDHRNAQFQQLRGEIQIPFEIRAVHDIQDNVRFFIQQIISGYDFFQRVRRQRINARADR